MSAAVSGSVKLADRVPNVSELTDLVGLIKGEVSKVQIPGMPLDKIKQLSGGFDITLPDTSAWPKVIPTDVTSFFSSFPDAATLTKPLGEPLTQITSVFSLDFAAEVGKFEKFSTDMNPPKFDSPEAFVNSLLEPFTKANDLIKNSQLSKLLAALGALLGAGELAKLSNDIPALITQLQTILKDKVGNSILAISSVSAAITLTEKTKRLADTISGTFSLTDTDARFQALLQEYGTGPTSLANLIRNLDFSDQVQVQTVEKRLVSTATAFFDFNNGIVRDMALTEAGLALLNVTNLQERFKKINETVSKVDAGQLKDLATAFNDALKKAKSAIDFDVDINLNKFKTLITGGLTKVSQEIEKLDPARIQEPLQSFFDVITGPLKKFEEFRQEIEAIVRGVLETIKEALGKIDLSSLRNGFDRTMGEIETTVGELEQLFTSVRKTIEDSLNQVKSVLEGARNFLLDPQDGLKKKIEDLFNNLFQLFDSLHLKETVDGISQTVVTISTGLDKIEFAPVIDATVEAVNVVTDILNTVAPLLVSDDLKKKLAEATAFLKEIDFDKIRDTLVTAFDEILASVDEEALGQFKVEYQKVIDGVDKFDPAPALRELQEEIFNPLIAELQKIKPAELLKPIQEGYDTAADALKGFDPAETFSFITKFFDDLLAKFHEISPAKLLEPIEKALDDVRNKINSVLRIDDLLAMINGVSNFLLPFIDQFSVTQLFDALDSGFTTLKTLLTEFDFDPATLLSMPANILRQIFSATGLEIDTNGVVAFFEALKSDAGTIAARLSSIQQTLAAGQAQLGRLDLKNYLTTLRARYDEVNASLALHAAVGAVQLQLAGQARLLDPMPLLSPLIPKVDRVKQTFAARSQEFANAVSGLSSAVAPAEAVIDALRSLISPLDLLKEMIFEPLQKLVGAPATTSARELLVQVLDQINPAQWKAELQPLMLNIQTKLKALFGEAVLGPFKSTLNSIKDQINLLDVKFLREAIEQVFGEIEAVIQQFNPTPFIEEVVATYKRILGLLDKLNPAQFITEIDQLYANDVVGLVKSISPEQLLLPVLQELFQKIKGLLVSLDIEVIFKPVLERLRTLRDQLAEGLTKAGDAFEGLVNAIPSGSGSAAASAGVSVG